MRPTPRRPQLPPEMLLGRRRECDELDRLLRPAAAGHGAAIVVLHKVFRKLGAKSRTQLARHVVESSPRTT